MLMHYYKFAVIG